MASKSQRAVTGAPAERWAELGRALQAWREDELGYKVRGRFAAEKLPPTPDGNVNTRLIQDLEKNYRPGTYTKFSLQDAAAAYEVPYDGPGSLLAFLRGDTDQLSRAAAAPAPRQGGTVEFLPGSLPPSPFLDPARTAADRPYAGAIWERVLDLPRRVTSPAAAQIGLTGDAAKAWDGSRFDLADTVWFVADLQRQADGGNPGAAAATGA